MQKTYRLNKNETLTVEAILHQIGNQEPYFSITGVIKDKTVRHDGGIVACGCLHEEILKADPSLSDLVVMHLSDQDGTPLHAVENGFYFLSNPKDYPAAVLAKHLRIAEDEAAQMIANKMNRAEFSAFVEEQRPRWKSEADNLIEKYNLEVTK
jgi:hypothetical protein